MAGATSAIGGPIVRKDAAQRVVTAPVLVPNEPDRHRHEYPAENIAAIAKGFLPGGEIDAMHTGGEAGYPTENYVAPQKLTFEDVDREVPAGTWMLSVKVTDDDVWSGVVDGTYGGLSVFGPIKRVLDGDGNELDLEDIAQPIGQPGGPPVEPAVANSFGATGITREIPPAPIGTSWTLEFERATHVSIVDDPAVQAASFVVAKSASGAGGTETPIMDDEFKERFETLQTAVEKSAEAAEAAQDSAEQAQETAQTALEEADGGGSGDSGESGELTEEGVREIVSESVAEALDGGGGGSDVDVDVDLGDKDLDELDESTVEALVDAGAIDEETAEALGAPATGVEKRLAAIEKSLQNLNGRGGAATQLDGIGDGEGSVGNDNVAAGLRGDIEVGEGGDGE